MNALWCFGMHERDADTSEETQGHKTLFRIVNVGTEKTSSVSNDKHCYV